MLTQERLKELLSYDQDTGLFTWNKKSGRQKKGGLAGTLCRGYIHIKIDSKIYQAHRLAWLYTYGEFPKMTIDNMDHDKLNNKISNLRDVSQTYNNQNIVKPRHDKQFSLPIGVSFCKITNLFRSQIRINGKTILIGRFKTIEEASISYIEAKKKHHPGTLFS